MPPGSFTMAPTLVYPAVETREPVNGCRCGAGWCPICGTDHLTEEQENVEYILRYDNQSRGGARVVRKKIGGE